MLPVYICEDDEQLRHMERTYLEKQIFIEGYDMEIVLCTGKPEEILDALSENPGRGIYFLDVELKGESMDGFSLGQEIRKRDARGFLIYVTAFRDLAFETFRYHLEALDYICKQDTEAMLAGISRCLRIVTERMCGEKDAGREYFTVKVLDVIRHIPMEDILYFSTAGRTHRIELHARQDRLDFIGSIQELEQELGEGFLRIHRAYLVQVSQIGQVDLGRREVVLKNGERCAFSRNKRQELLKRVPFGQ